ncbi:MAG: prolipoprotein diacylglyceryl transferase [Candidatus Gracilibacteria bacterium]|nr:prolipoprotein diacylglyceryl transferase [Candidatus Gracilibacteria bacterium]
MVKRLSHRFGVNSTFFFNRILIYFLSIFFFSRVFYVISKWDSFKYIESYMDFFLMTDYNFSLFGAIFGFLLVLFVTVIVNGLRSGKYIDVGVLAFLFTSFFGYIGAFLGGQIYGKQTNFGIEILYNTQFSNVGYQVPIFPLPIVYSLIFIILFAFLYIISIFINIRGIIGYFGLILFSTIILIFEKFNGETDYFLISYGVNFNQIMSIFLIILSFVGLFRIYKTPVKKDIIN